MSLVRHQFTSTITSILDDLYNNTGNELLVSSPLLQYINIKTRAANRGSKSRLGLANHYAIYVLVEDYVKKGYLQKDNYADYEGARFSDLLARQRELPFGSKLQNHALNHRLNLEFIKYFPQEEYLVIRDVESNRYWINEDLIQIEINSEKVNISQGILKIIDSYVKARIEAFNSFMEECSKLLEINEGDPSSSISFIRGLLQPNVDARIFEIVSFSILKYYFAEKVLYWGWSVKNLHKDNLTLYKTGRTNANDGGIDFVMKPLGRFFQVTETVDARKYFLDIDKVQRFPITFVVKSNDSVNQIRNKLKEQATKKYKVKKIVEKYIEAVEEIINVPMLITKFEQTIDNGKLSGVVSEIISQSRVEFNLEEGTQYAYNLRNNQQ